jgi:hypothetical protein
MLWLDAFGRPLVDSRSYERRDEIVFVTEFERELDLS